MSAASPGASWQRADLAASYFDRRQILLPLLDVQEDVIRHLITRHDHPVGRFLDVGSGDGAMSELVLAAVPSSQAELVDFSEPMLAHARERLARFGGRWRAIPSDLADPSWRGQLPSERYGLIVSGLAIHHLPGERKRELFGELFALLEPGGMFVNMDYVSIDGPLRGLFDEQMRAKAVHHEHEAGGRRSDDEVDLEDDEDRPDSASDQIQWLRDAGFDEAELHFKWAEAAIFGAIRPSDRAR